MIPRYRVVLLPLVLFGAILGLLHQFSSFSAFRSYSTKTSFSSSKGRRGPWTHAQVQETYTRYPGLKRGIEKLRGSCKREGDRYVREYGKANLRLTRSYTGSLFRVHRFLSRTLLAASSPSSSPSVGFLPSSWSSSPSNPIIDSDLDDHSHSHLHSQSQEWTRDLHLTPPVISVLGGSVTEGFAIWKSQNWFEGFADWMGEDLFDLGKGEGGLFGGVGGGGGRGMGAAEGVGTGEKGKVERWNGAVPATGSDYFSFCSSLHIPSNSTLIFIELSINDEYIPSEHTENMENLLRSLLDMEEAPAVVLVQAMEFNSGTIAGGGDVHLPVAVYYDVPVLSQRNALGPHFMRHPDLISPFFAVNWWQDSDLRHINARGHQDLSSIARSLFAEAACELVEGTEEEILQRVLGYAGSLMGMEKEVEDSEVGEERWDLDEEMAEMVRPWGPYKKAKEEEGTERTWRGVWGPERWMGQIPRLRFFNRWDETHTNVPLQPQCFSTRSTTHPLVPTRSSGWFSWSSPERPDKVYLFANVTGSTFDFDIETRMGTIKMYSLRSKTFGLGSVWCWVDDDEDGGVRADGWWDNGDVNIGRFTTIKTDLPRGQHTVHCRLLEETLDPAGGNEFRIISIMSN